MRPVSQNNERLLQKLASTNWRPVRPVGPKWRSCCLLVPVFVFFLPLLHRQSVDHSIDNKLLEATRFHSERRTRMEPVRPEWKRVEEHETLQVEWVLSLFPFSGHVLYASLVVRTISSLRVSVALPVDKRSNLFPSLIHGARHEDPRSVSCLSFCPDGME